MKKESELFKLQICVKLSGISGNGLDGNGNGLCGNGICGNGLCGNGLTGNGGNGCNDDYGFNFQNELDQFKSLMK